MKNRFKTITGALALTFMLLFGAVAFALNVPDHMCRKPSRSRPAPVRRRQRRQGAQKFDLHRLTHLADLI